MILNFDIFEFTLSDEDMKTISNLDEGKSLFFPHYDPEIVERLIQMGKSR